MLAEVRLTAPCGGSSKKSVVTLRALRLPSVAVVALIGLLVAGCGAAPTTPPAANPTPDIVTAPTATCDSANCTLIDVELDDFTIVPSTFSAPAGRIRFILTNTGQYTHSLQVEMRGGAPASPLIGAGSTGFLDVDLQAGEYRMICPIPGHPTRGQRAVLTVTAGS